MAKFKNKRLHITVSEYLTAFLVMVLSFAGFFFYKQYSETNEKYNLKRTSVDFIISAPSQEQVSEISTLSHVNSIVPCIYRSVEISSGKKTIETNLYIIEKVSDLNNTVFSDALLITKSSKGTQNPIFLSNDSSLISSFGIEDKIVIDIDGTEVEFTVSGIYGSDKRNVGGTIIAVLNDDILAAMNGTYRYNTAYIDSSNIPETREYLETYQPKGDLRTRDEFDSENAYQIYLSEKNSEEGESIIDCEQVIESVGKRNDTKLFKNFILFVICMIAALAVLFCSVCVRLARYTKKNVGKDIRNNFSLKQEKQMYSAFCCSDVALVTIVYAIVTVVSYFVLKIDNCCVFLLSGIVIFVLMFIVEYCIAKMKLDIEFARQIKILEQEKKTRNGIEHEV